MGLTTSVTPRFKIDCLDNRFTGYKHFRYRVKTLGDYTVRYSTFIDIRTWCWDTWGSSCERDILIELADRDEGFLRLWSWHTERYNKRFADVYIYLASDAELSLFELKWM